MNWGGRQISRLFTGPDGRQLATTVASTPEELQETTHRTLQYLLQLSPQHLQAYEEHLAPDAALQAIQDASAAARPNTAASPSPRSRRMAASPCPSQQHRKTVRHTCQPAMTQQPTVLRRCIDAARQGRATARR